MQDSNGQINLDGSDLPGETESGIAVDSAVVSATAVLAKTANQTLADGVLVGLAAQALRAGGPLWADVTDSKNVPRRVSSTSTRPSSSHSATTLGLGFGTS